jgi:hypothetical protein
LDYDSSSAFLNLRWRQSRRVSFFLESAVDRVKYVEDYSYMTDLDPLDYRSSTLRPGASVDLGASAVIGISLVLTDLDFDRRTALDRSGTEVPGTRREYRYSQLHLKATVEPAENWKLSGGFLGNGRDDTYDGYYDSETRLGFFAVERSLGARSKLRAQATIRDVSYDRATVTGDPEDGLLGNDERRYLGRFEQALGPHLRWFVEAGSERTDSEDPLFAYERQWALSGVHYGRE